MPVKQAIQSQFSLPASLPCIITFLGKCVSGSCITRMQGGAKNPAERRQGPHFFPTALRRCQALHLVFNGLQANASPAPPSLPRKRVCTRSSGPINCLDYSMCRYLTAVLVAARR